MQYYYTDIGNRAVGPVSIEQLRALAASGTVNASTMVAAVGSQQWVPIGTVVHVGPAAPASRGGLEPLALWSFILSLVSLLCCGLIVAIPGIVCGHLALSKIGRNPHLDGRGLSIAGLVIGYISAVGWFLYMVFFGGLAILQAMSGM